MLSLEVPAQLIGGLLLYADHADPNTYYYAAPNPHIAQAGGRPMFDIFSYAVELKSSPLSGTKIPDELGAGFLTMGADCALEDGLTQRVLGELATHLGRDRDGLSLAPIPYTKGTVSVIALDAASGAAANPTAAATPGRPIFVEKIVGGGTPSLLGDLRSIFSLSLSQQGVTFLQGLYADHAAPIGIIYDLKFLGLRPSVQATVHADVEKIYTEFGGKVSVGCAYVRAEVEATLSKLRQTGAITVKLTSFAVGDEAAKAEELAMSLFKDKIIQHLFNPTATPQIPNFQVPGQGGQSMPSIVTLSLKMRKDEESRTIDYDFSLRAPEERTHAPQAFLGALLSKDQLAQHIHQVDLASPFFELLEVLVSGPSAEEFAALSLTTVTVDLTYGGPGDPVPPESGTLQFRAAGITDLTWAAKRRGRPTLAYSYEITYEFSRGGGVDADVLTYRTPPRTHTGRTLGIRPYDDFTVLDVEAENGRLPAEVTAVDIALDYHDQASGFSAHQDLRLPTAAVPPPAQRHWQVRVRQAEAEQYTANASLTFADGSVFALPPIVSGEPLLRIDAPFTATRTLLVQPNVTSPDVTSITVEITYDDDIGKYHRRFLQTLVPTVPTAANGTTPPPGTPAPPASWLPVTLSWPILAAARQEFKYRVTTAAGGIVEASDWQPSADPSLLVGTVGQRSRKAEVRLIGPLLKDVGVDGVSVRVGSAGSADEDSVSVFFDPAGPVVQPVTVPAAVGAPPGFRYQTTSFHSDGSQRQSQWLPAPTSLIAITSRTV